MSKKKDPNYYQFSGSSVTADVSFDPSRPHVTVVSGIINPADKALSRIKRTIIRLEKILEETDDNKKREEIAFALAEAKTARNHLE